MNQHPVWNQSKVPISVLDKLNNSNSAQRRFYLADLIHSYESKLSQLTPIARRMVKKWAEGQDSHLRKVISELYDMQRLETSGVVVRDGVTYKDDFPD